MTAAWLCMIIANLACAGILWHKQARRTVLCYQMFSAGASLLFVVLYFWRGCSRSDYEISTYAVDVMCSILELYVAVRMQEAMLTAIIALHQLVKMQWHWAALPFHYPDDACLTFARRLLNVLVMVAFIVVAYKSEDATASGEHHEQAGD